MVEVTIHPTAVVEPGAELGVGVKVGCGAVVESAARVGDHCQIGHNSVVHSYTTLESGVVVHPLAVVGGAPQDFSFKGERSFVHIGEDTAIRECATVHRSSKPEGTTRVGRGCMLMATSHVGHDCVVGDRVVVANCALLAGHVQVGDGAFLSGNTAMRQFVRVGELVMVSGGAIVSRDVAPFCLLHPTALNEVTGLNRIGIERASYPPEHVRGLDEAYTLVFSSHLSAAEAVRRIKAAAGGPLALRLAEFVETSKLGVCRPTPRS